MTNLIHELASIRIREGYEQTFEEHVAQATESSLRDPACHSVELLRSIEMPLQFRSRLGWESVEAHERFRSTDGIRRWRELVGSLFAEPPMAEHAYPVVFTSRKGQRIHEDGSTAF